jgi:four helix bundle protein
MNFKDLIVWQKSMTLAKLIYKITSQFPKNEMYGLASQMQRCSVSIPSNIAEGHGRNNKREYFQFLGIAYGSCSELETQILIAKSVYQDLNYAEPESLLLEVQKMLGTIISTLRASK